MIGGTQTGGMADWLSTNKASKNIFIESRSGVWTDALGAFRRFDDDGNSF